MIVIMITPGASSIDRHRNLDSEKLNNEKIYILSQKIFNSDVVYIRNVRKDDIDWNYRIWGFSLSSLFLTMFSYFLFRVITGEKRKRADRKYLSIENFSPSIFHKIFLLEIFFL